MKLNPREMHTKILSKTLKFEVAVSKNSYKCLILRKVPAKYPTKPIFLHLKSFELMPVLVSKIRCVLKYFRQIKYIINQKSLKFLRTHYTILLHNFVTTSDILSGIDKVNFAIFRPKVPYFV